jgi:adenylate kinase family enzyme
MTRIMLLSSLWLYTGAYSADTQGCLKIAIIGNAGSGKSTLGTILHKKLDIPLYHLDHYRWKPGWEKRDDAEFTAMHNQLCDGGGWIIEGAATHLFEYRALKADTIIFLDMPTWLCLYRVLKRAFMSFGTIGDSNPPGCPERMPTFQFLSFVWSFNKERKPFIEAILEKYRSTKRIFVVQNQHDLEHMLESIAQIKKELV